MGTLKENLTEIKRQKDTYLLPENLKQGVTCLGITGTLTPGSETGGGVKLFTTVDEMNADPNPQEGDLAVVYREEVKNATVDSRFQVATFPDTVVLDSAMTDFVEVRYRPVDSSVMFDCMGSLDSSMFRMDCYTETGEVRIQYTSSDGITYTRTDSTGNPVDFGTEIYYEMTEMWNDAIGKFIQAGGMYFDGLYQNKYVFSNILRANVLIDTNGKLYNVPIFNYTKDYTYAISILESHLVDLVRGIYEIDKCEIYELNTSSVGLMNILVNTVNKKKEQYIIGSFSNSYKSYIITKYVCDFSLANPITSSIAYQYGSDTISSLTNVKTTDNELKIISPKLSDVLICSFNDKFELSPRLYSFSDPAYRAVTNVLTFPTTQDNIYTEVVNDTTTRLPEILMYNPAPTQLTTTPDYVYEKEFYGKNGIENGTLTQGISNSFTDTNAAVYSKIKDYYDSLEPRVLTDDDKTIDKNIYCIPIKKDEVPLLDTSSVTNMRYMFQDCTNLTTIPLLNTNSVIEMSYMFSGCTNLTTIPLLNTSSATAMNAMFDKCTNLITIPLLDTSSVTSMIWMFRYCTNLTTIPLLDTSKVTNMDSMFGGCKNLTEIPLLDTSSVTIMASMFYDCINLTTIPLLDTSSVTDAHWMFDKCTNLTAIPELDTSKVTNMQYMFSGCTNLTTIPLLNTSKVKTMSWMFNSCTNLADESLNNILLMCANATSYTDTKTLKDIGLTSEQANKCKTLSNYSAFTSAGWTTGY